MSINQPVSSLQSNSIPDPLLLFLPNPDPYSFASGPIGSVVIRWKPVTSTVSGGSRVMSLMKEGPIRRGTAIRCLHRLDGLRSDELGAPYQWDGLNIICIMTTEHQITSVRI